MDSTFDTTTVSSGGLDAGAIITILLVSVLFYAIFAILLGKIFKKAGEESWKAWVPIYNSWVMLELGGQKGFWAVLSFVPIVNIVAAIMLYVAQYHIGLKLGKGGWFVIIAILFPAIWIIWLALDKSTWQGEAVPTAAPTPEFAEPAPVVPPVATPQPNQDQNNTPPSAPLVQ